MKVSKLIFFRLFCLLALIVSLSTMKAQSTDKEFHVDPDGQLISRAIADSVLSYTFSYHEEPIIWSMAGDADYLVILQLDKERIISSAELIPFRGVKSFTPVAEEYFRRFVGVKLEPEEGVELKEYYALPVLVRGKYKESSDPHLACTRFFTAMIDNRKIALLEPLRVGYRAPFYCFSIRKPVVPPWEKDKAKEEVSGTFTAKDILELGRRKN